MDWRAAGTMLMVLRASAGASAQPVVDLSTLDAKLAGAPAQVLVLGTVHLSQDLPKDADPTRSLQPLLDRLAAFRPEIIAIESIPGEQCELMARYPAVYGPIADNPYCGDNAAAHAATGLDVPAAVAEVHRTLATWPAQPTAAQRRHLSALFLAANDDESALVQWLQLPEAERRAGDGLDAVLVEQLRKAEAWNGESFRIAARLAARLGLPRVYPVDDHTGDSYDVDDEKAFGDAIGRAWASADAQTRPQRDHAQALLESGDMLALYRYINMPEVLRVQVAGDMGVAMQDAVSPHYGRWYVTGWETRNLRMVANTSATFRTHPDARVLVIVGSTHKPWFDSLLGQMQGVEIVDVARVLE
jgi:hypothetical protein